MDTDHVDLGSLSQAALLALDYVVRHQAGRVDSGPVMDVARTLRGAYPLVRYLFESAADCEAAIEELQREGWLTRALRADEKWRQRLRRNVVECIRFKAIEIVKRMHLRDIGQVAESAGEDDNVEKLNEDLRFLNHTPLSVAAQLSNQYSKALLEMNSDVERHKLVRLVAEKAGMSPVEIEADEDGCPLPGGLYESSSFAPSTLFRATLALVDLQGEYDEQLNLAEGLADGQGNLVLLLLGETGAAAARLARLCESKLAVLIRAEDLKRIALSSHPVETMREIVFPQVRPSTLSPFRYVGPVTGDCFFGRRLEMQRVLNSASGNFVILGARTIGKTSLLLTMRDGLTNGPQRGRAIPVFVDGTQNRQLRHFQQNLMQAILTDTEQFGVRIDWIDPGGDFFEDLALSLRNSGQRYLLLIDEIDNLLQCAEISRFEEFVRSMSNIGCGRFVISGYRNLREHTEDRASFFFNLFEPIILSPLDRRDADELVRRQMARICVGFESDNVVESVLEYGSTFASYLQQMCHLLLCRLDERRRNRTISIEDVKAVYNGEEFTTAITSAVTAGHDRPMEELEQLILYWAAASPLAQFTEQDLLEGLARWVYPLRLTEVRKALKYLTLTYLLVESGGRYRYYLRLLRDKLRQEPNLEFVIENLAREYHNLDRT